MLNIGFDAFVSRAMVPGFEISEELYEAGQRLPAHVHPHPHLIVVFDGEIHETAGDDVRRLERSQIVFFPAGIHHTVRFETRSILLSIEARAEREATVTELFRNVRRFTAIPGGELLPLTTRIRDELRRTGPNASVALEGLALELMAFAARQMEGQGASRVPRLAMDAKEIVDRRYSARIGLSEVAAEIGTSPVRLAEAFRRGYDCTVGDYIRRKRVQHAVEMLVNTGRPLGDIALEAGFCDQPHLVRVFKLFTGMTPARYRRAHRSFEARA